MGLIIAANGGTVTSPSGQLTLTIPAGALAVNRNIQIFDSPTRATPDPATTWAVHNTWVIWADGPFPVALTAAATFHHVQPHPTLPATFFSHDTLATPMPDGGGILPAPGVASPPLAEGTTIYLPTLHGGPGAGPPYAGAAPAGMTSYLSLMY